MNEVKECIFLALLFITLFLFLIAAAFLKDRKPWIVKPVASSRGRGIYLVSHVSGLNVSLVIIILLFNGFILRQSISHNYNYLLIFCNVIVYPQYFYIICPSDVGYLLNTAKIACYVAQCLAFDIDLLAAKSSSS